MAGCGRVSYTGISAAKLDAPSLPSIGVSSESPEFKKKTRAPAATPSPPSRLSTRPTIAAAGVNQLRGILGSRLGLDSQQPNREGSAGADTPALEPPSPEGQVSRTPGRGPPTPLTPKPAAPEPRRQKVLPSPRVPAVSPQTPPAAKGAAAATPPPPSAKFWCGVCCVSASSEQQLREHCGGAKHAEAVRKQPAQPAAERGERPKAARKLADSERTAGGQPADSPPKGSEPSKPAGWAAAAEAPKRRADGAAVEGAHTVGKPNQSSFPPSHKLFFTWKLVSGDAVPFSMAVEELPEAVEAAFGALAFCRLYTVSHAPLKRGQPLPPLGFAFACFRSHEDAAAMLAPAAAGLEALRRTGLYLRPKAWAGDKPHTEAAKDSSPSAARSAKQPRGAALQQSQPLHVKDAQRPAAAAPIEGDDEDSDEAMMSLLLGAGGSSHFVVYRTGL